MSYHCKKCGQELSDEALYCTACGAKQPRGKDLEVIEKAKGKPKALIGALVALLVIGSGLFAFANHRATHAMPDVVDMDVQDAVAQLTRGGLDDGQITFVDEKGNEVQDQDDWVVIKQEPASDEDINTRSGEVVLTVFDQPAFEYDQISDSEGDKLAEVVSTAEEFDYQVEIKPDDPENPITINSFKNSNEKRQEEWVVTDISNIDKDRKTVTIVADTEANIKAKEEAERLAKAEAELKQCGGQSVPEATGTADEWNFRYKLINYNKEDCTKAYDALDDAKKAQWQVLSVKQINKDQSEVSFVVDTKDNIASRERAAIKKCVNQSVIDAQAVLDKYKYSYELVNYDGKDYTSNYAAYSAKQKKQWVVLAVSDIDTDQKTVTLSMDTKKNIVARQKAEAKKKAEAKRKAEAKKKARARKRAAAKKKAAEEAAAAAAAAAEAEAAAAATRSSGSGTMVWIPRTGSKYHSNPNCSNMKNPSQVTLSQAQSMGYDACKKCY